MIFFFENLDFFKCFGKKKNDFDENEPTGFVFHGRKEKNLPSRIGNNLQLKRKRFFLNIYPNRILIIDWPDFVADADGQRFLANYFWLSSLGLINLVSYFWEYNKLCFEVNHLSLLYCLWLYCMKNSKLLWRLQLPDFSKSTSPALVSIFVYLLRN